MRKQIQLSENTLKKIAEALFLAYTAEQAAYIGGISRNTLLRIRKTDTWAKIEEWSLLLEKPYREKVWKGSNGWQGAAWMLERKYASQLARPDIQLQVNAANSTTNNTLVITAEQASGLRARSATIDQELQKLVPPGSKTGPIIPIMSPEHMSDKTREAIIEANTEGEPIDDTSTSTSEKDFVKEEAPGATPTRTPYARRAAPEPHLTPNLKSVISSSNYKSRTEKRLAAISINRQQLAPQKSGPPRKIPHNFPKKLEPVKTLDKPDKSSKSSGTGVAVPPVPKKRGKVPPIILRGVARGPRSKKE